MPQQTLTARYATRLPSDVWDRVLIVAIFVSIWLIAVTALWSGVFEPLFHAASKGWVAVVLRPSVLWFGMGVLLLTLRTLLWVRYKERAHATHDDAPMLTVIIPAYNEGAMVQKTIDSCVAAHYPRARLEIIVVDDGSRDDTWQHIMAAAARHPDLVTPIRFPENRGKRAALAAGFERARGEIFVTIDSDSLVEPQTLLAIAGPFRDPRVGAVAGKVVVYNRDGGWIPRMLQVRFTLSFDFLRAVQSTYGSVYCCPGALAGYRASLVKQILPRWLNQRFLGVNCTIGEDRALTNDILSLGYDTVYQRGAVVHTLVPTTYRKLCRMYLRWDRSYIREELRLARIVWKRPFYSRCMTIFEQTFTNLRFPIAWTALVLLVVLSIEDPYTVVRVLISIGTVATLYALYYLRSERSWNFVYGVFYAYFSFFTLFWVFPYALMTVRQRSWMTR
ncbi:MAG: glycosyltransferase [Burkholderiales bacterium]